MTLPASKLKVTILGSSNSRTDLLAKMPFFPVFGMHVIHRAQLYLTGHCQGLSSRDLQYGLEHLDMRRYA
jgi:acetaldehyde dehydrogenase (acetylating)